MLVFIKHTWAGICSYSDEQIEQLCKAISDAGFSADGSDKGFDVEVADMQEARNVQAIAASCGFDGAEIEDDSDDDWD